MKRNSQTELLSVSTTIPVVLPEKRVYTLDRNGRQSVRHKLGDRWCRHCNARWRWLDLNVSNCPDCGIRLPGPKPIYSYEMIAAYRREFLELERLKNSRICERCGSTTSKNMIIRNGKRYTYRCWFRSKLNPGKWLCTNCGHALLSSRSWSVAQAILDLEKRKRVVEYDLGLYRAMLEGKVKSVKERRKTIIEEIKQIGSESRLIAAYTRF